MDVSIFIAIRSISSDSVGLAFLVVLWLVSIGIVYRLFIAWNARIDEDGLTSIMDIFVFSHLFGVSSWQGSGSRVGTRQCDWVLATKALYQVAAKPGINS